MNRPNSIDTQRVSATMIALSLSRSCATLIEPSCISFIARPRSFRLTTPRYLNVSIEAVKELRRRTGAPVGAVKKALEDQSGDLQAAIDHLRKLGASMAAKKAHREASEGLIGITISPDSTKASIVELNAETDFVARTAQFGELLRSISKSAMAGMDLRDGNSVAEIDPNQLLDADDNKAYLLNAVSSLGENIVLKRASCMQIKDSPGAIFGYVHNAVGEYNGSIGALVALKGEDLEKEVGHRLAMHVAAAAPSYIAIESIPEKDVAKEREILIQAARAEQKPGMKEKSAAVLEKIAEGRLKKWFSGTVLYKQEMLVEPSSYNGSPRTVSEYLATEAKNAEILGVCRFAVGEK